MCLAPFLSILLGWMVKGQLPNRQSDIQWMSFWGQSGQTLKSRKSNIIARAFTPLLVNGTLSLESPKLKQSRSGWRKDEKPPPNKTIRSSVMNKTNSFEIYFWPQALFSLELTYGACFSVVGKDYFKHNKRDHAVNKSSMRINFSQIVGSHLLWWHQANSA